MQRDTDAFKRSPVEDYTTSFNTVSIVSAMQHNGVQCYSGHNAVLSDAPGRHRYSVATWTPLHLVIVSRSAMRQVEKC